MTIAQETSTTDGLQFDLLVLVETEIEENIEDAFSYRYLKKQAKVNIF